jgi:undecaprenyl-diphosphatase
LPILHAIVLGIVQGLSEFLPISSSGHLVLVPWLFGWDELPQDLNRAFDVALHMGTFVGAVIYFRRDIWRFILRDRRMGWLLLLASVPAALTGVVLDNVIEDHSEWLIGVMLIVFALVLLWADGLPERRKEGEFGTRDALLMGAAQALALQPGVSRSGVTISMSRWLGFERDAAARLSFLMSVPIIGGAGLYEGMKVAADGGLPAGMVAPFFWGTVASAITGFVAIWALLKVVRTWSFTPFVVYRIILGLAVIATAMSSVRCGGVYRPHNAPRTCWARVARLVARLA